MADSVLITSKDRLSGDINDLVFECKESLEGSYELTFFQMTNNIYNVSTGENDKVYLTHSVDGVQEITLDKGSYDAADLAVELKAKLDAISAVVYTVSYALTTGKYTISPDSGTLQFTFGTNTSASARKLLGFLEADTLAAASLVSDVPIDLKLHDMIVVSVLQDNLSYVTLPSGVEASLLIPIENIEFGSRIFHSRNQNFNQLIRFTNSTSRLSVRLFSIDGDLLDINGADWVMAFRRYSS